MNPKPPTQAKPDVVFDVEKAREATFIAGPVRAKYPELFSYLRAACDIIESLQTRLSTYEALDRITRVKELEDERDQLKARVTHLEEYRDMCDQHGAELEKAQARVAKLVEALWSLRNTECWCDMGIGNPMYRDHSAACKAVFAALAKDPETK